MQKKIKKNSEKQVAKVDFILVIIVFLLLSIGVVMVLSASAPTSFAETGKSYTYFLKQLMFAIAGLGFMAGFSKLNYKVYYKFRVLIYIFAVLLMFAVLLPKIGSTGGGATRWVKIGIRFQPSEILKTAMIIVMAGYFMKYRDKMGSFKYDIIGPALILALPVIALLFIQSHLSATIIVTLVSLTIMVVAGIKLRYLFGICACGIAGVIGIGIHSLQSGTTGSYQIARIKSFFDPFADKTGAGWQVIQSLYAIGSGGLFGVGFGGSKQKYLYIPEPHNDFIFPILAEELGLLGCTVVIVLFGLFIWRGFVIAMNADDLFGTLVATGITVLIGLEAILNIAVVTGLIPNTGIPLPFFSYGGTSLLITLASVGILLNISRSSKKI